MFLCRGWLTRAACQDASSTLGEGALGVVMSRHILDEMVRVLPKLSHNKRNLAEIRGLADDYLLKAEIVEPCSGLEVDLRDKTDQPVLGTLRSAHADYLITGDKDLLALAGRYPIVTPAAFWERHGSSGIWSLRNQITLETRNGARISHAQVRVSDFCRLLLGLRSGSCAAQAAMHPSRVSTG